MMRNLVGEEATGKIPKLRGFLPHSSINVLILKAMFSIASHMFLMYSQKN